MSLNIKTIPFAEKMALTIAILSSDIVFLDQTAVNVTVAGERMLPFEDVPAEQLP